MFNSCENYFISENVILLSFIRINLGTVWFSRISSPSQTAYQVKIWRHFKDDWPLQKVETSPSWPTVEKRAFRFSYDIRLLTSETIINLFVFFTRLNSNDFLCSNSDIDLKCWIFSFILPDILLTIPICINTTNSKTIEMKIPIYMDQQYK